MCIHEMFSRVSEPTDKYLADTFQLHKLNTPSVGCHIVFTSKTDAKVR